VLYQRCHPPKNSPSSSSAFASSSSDASTGNSTTKAPAAPAPFVLRSEFASTDAKAIKQLVAVAFKGKHFSDGNEQFIVDALRARGELAISLVAVSVTKDEKGHEKESEIVGHVAFSRVTIADGTTDWYGMGPVAVTPTWQKRGVGSALIRQGLLRLQELGARGCVVLGDPTYYGRFGWKNDPKLTYPGPEAQFFMAMRLPTNTKRISSPAGVVKFSVAFEATS
jgi:putative acetyltransferase